MSNYVICQVWEESERGWGCRPDGFTLHLTREDRDAFVEAFWKRQKEQLGASTPDEYTRTSGDPYKCPVNEAILAQITESENGTWSRGSAPWPASGGGWKPDKPKRLDGPEATLG